jgi:sugar phosphate isomerase/epimerase
MVHLKDVKPTTKTNYALQQDPCEVGLGKLNWHAILPACAAAGCSTTSSSRSRPLPMTALTR